MEVGTNLMAYTSAVFIFFSWQYWFPSVFSITILQQVCKKWLFLMRKSTLFMGHTSTLISMYFTHVRKKPCFSANCWKTSTVVRDSILSALYRQPKILQESMKKHIRKLRLLHLFLCQGFNKVGYWRKKTKKTIKTKCATALFYI